MRVTDIKVGHIYFVDFDPVRECEFDRRHLAIVMKKNNDNKTFVVMPLTSAYNGNGINKCKLENAIFGLPSSLASNDTYAVYNQLRAVNASRFIAVKDEGNTSTVSLKQETFLELFNLTILDLMHNLNMEDKLNILKTGYEKQSLSKATSLAYDIIKKEKALENKMQDILYMKNELWGIIRNVPSILEAENIDSAVLQVFKDASIDN